VNTYLSADQQATREQYKTYAREHLASCAEQISQGKGALKEFLQKLGQQGYLGLTVPKEYGGQSLPFLNAVWLAEAIGHYQPAIAVVLAEHITVIELIKKFGTDTQKSRYLPLLARGESLAATAFNEPTAGTDFKSAKTEAKRENNQINLSGTKTVVVNAPDLGLAVVSAIDSEGGKLALLLVEMSEEPASVKISAGQKLLGMDAIAIHDVVFTSRKLTADAELKGPAEGAAELIMYAGDIAKTIVAAAATGMTEQCLSTAVIHANAREQFGQKIAQFQGIQWKIADMSMDNAAAQMLVYRAAWSKEEAPSDFRNQAAMCKWYAAKTARLHSGEAIQILGVSGLLANSPIEQFYRDAKVMELCEGTSEYQKVIIADELGV